MKPKSVTLCHDAITVIIDQNISITSVSQTLTVWAPKVLASALINQILNTYYTNNKIDDLLVTYSLQNYPFSAFSYLLVSRNNNIVC